MKTPEKYVYQIYIDSSKKDEREVVLQKKLSNGDVVVQEVERITGKIDIVSEIQKLLKNHNLKPKDISFYDFNAGPGSFTGLKTGSAVANVMNWALSKKKSTELKKIEYGGEPNIQK